MPIVTIGLEVHVQLKTKSKMFCACDNTGEDKTPNTTICPICTGQPGTLPAPNKQAIEWSIKTALALHCTIPTESHFDRKHYYYPDLPKGYQISQMDRPLGSAGFLDITSRGIAKKVRINRLHLEEDAAKLVHDGDWSGVDFNRGGTPLMEIVTEPDLETPQQAKAYMQELRLLMTYLGVSDADMEKGHLRCDASISVRPEGQAKLNPRMEIKNLNSFRAVERALSYEQKRLTDMLGDDNYPTADETRSWDEEKSATKTLRKKESSADYRYFPEPDIPPLKLDAELTRMLLAQLPELPWQKRERFMVELGFSAAHALQFAEDKDLAAFAEEVISELREWLTERGDLEGTSEEIWEKHCEKMAKFAGNWLVGEFLKHLHGVSMRPHESKIKPAAFAEFLTLLFERKINNTQAQMLFEAMFERGGSPHALVEELDLRSLGGEKELHKLIEQAIASNPDAVADFRSGKQNAIQFLVGQVMKLSKGKADAAEAREKIVTFLTK